MIDDGDDDFELFRPIADDAERAVAERVADGRLAAMSARAVRANVPRSNRARYVMLLAAALLIAVCAWAFLHSQKAPTLLPPPVHVERVDPSIVPMGGTPLAAPAPSPVATEPATVSPTVSVPPTTLDAAALFAKANGARHDGSYDDADRTYRELLTRYPTSQEAIASRAILGRMILDRNGDAAAALALFDKYLADAPRGALAESAMWGRAVALRRLGKVADEKAALDALLAAFPDSPHEGDIAARKKQLQQ